MLFALPLPVRSSVRVVTWFALFEALGYPAGITRAHERTLSAPAKRKQPNDLRELIAMPRLGHHVLRAKGFVV